MATLISQASFAVEPDTCGTQLLLEKDLGPIRDQADSSWCWAYTSADLLTQKLRAERPPRIPAGSQISAFQIAGHHILAQSMSPSEALRRGESPSAALQSLSALNSSSSGLCLERQFPSGKGTKNPFYLRTEKAAGKKIAETFRGFWTQQGPSLDPCQSDPLSNFAFEHLGDQVHTVGKAAWAKELSKCKIPTPPLEVRTLTFEGRAERLLARNTTTPEDPEIERQLGARLDEVLSAGRIAGITYDSSFLGPGKTVGLHASSIVGRFRGTDGVCYYKLRNSWGPGCKGYHPKYACKKGTLQLVPRDDLLRNMSEVTDLP